MSKSSFLLLIIVIATFSVLLVGCNSSSGTSAGGSPVGPLQGSVPVSLTLTDDPPAGVSVLFFEVSLTAAALNPAVGTGASVSLLNGNNPIQIDVTQLQARSAFLSTVNVPGNSYGSLDLTFANPQIVIFNQSDTSLGASCPVQSICTLAPAIDNSATVHLASSPFPVTLSGSTPLGFVIDFHLNTIIQSDLSVNLGVANGVTISEVPPNATAGGALFGFVEGTVGTVTGNQFTLATAWGKTFTIETNTNTKFVDWPPCASPGALSCLTSGSVVRVQVAGINSDGSLLAASITWLLSANQQSVEGTVVGYDGGHIKLVLHAAPSATASVPIGGEANVTLDQNAAFSVDANGFTIPSGYTFSGVDNLTRGQELQVAIDQGSLSCATSNIVTSGGWGSPAFCNFSTSSVQLEPSQMSGIISVIDASNSSFTLGSFLPIAFGPWAPAAVQGTEVDTTSETTYEGFATDDFSALAVNDLVSVNGWLFENDNGMLDPAITPPKVLAQNVTLHSGGKM
jgi:hypothetical protein